MVSRTGACHSRNIGHCRTSKPPLRRCGPRGETLQATQIMSNSLIFDADLMRDAWWPTALFASLRQTVRESLHAPSCLLHGRDWPLPESSTSVISLRSASLGSTIHAADWPEIRMIDFPIGGFSPPEGRLARGCKPPAFSRFLFQSAV